MGVGEVPFTRAPFGHNDFYQLSISDMKRFALSRDQGVGTRIKLSFVAET
jgi:hypothetical protein